MLGKAAIKQGWYWEGWWHPTVQGELEKGAWFTPRARVRKGMSPGVLGAFPPIGEGPARPHRPQRVDVDEAGGIGRLVVPLHVHAAERKAPSLRWDSRGELGQPVGKGDDVGDPRPGCSQLLLPPHPLVAAGGSGQGPCQPLEKGTWLRSSCPQAPQALPETQPQISLLGPSRASAPFLPVLWHHTGMFTLFQSNPTGLAVPGQAIEKGWDPGQETLPQA